MLKHSGIDAAFLRSCVNKKCKIYFSGMGGVGMSALAELLASEGITVEGSDSTRTSVTERLEELGINISYSQRAENITASLPELFVYSLSVSENNPEYREAVRLGIPSASRAELLGAVMLDYKYRIGVSGSHGKSTVTAMIGRILSEAGLSPTVISGSDLGGGSSLAVGGREYLVYEACEYCDSFLHFYPTHSVLLNVDFDHADYFADMAAVCRSFAKAAERSEVLTVYRADDAALREIARGMKVKGMSFGEREGAELVFEVEESGADCILRPRGYSPIPLAVRGRHNAENAAAAFSASLALGVDPSAASRALSEFRGIPRRLERLACRNGKAVFYDYGHHPKEIKLTIDTLKKMSYNRIAAVFSPHTYSRTRALFDGFAEAFSSLSLALILPIFGAREEEGDVSAETLVEGISARGGNALAYSGSLDPVLEGDFDCILLIGAGDLSQIKQRIEKYEKNNTSCGSFGAIDPRGYGDGNCRE